MPDSNRLKMLIIMNLIVALFRKITSTINQQMHLYNFNLK